jgi:hypothetical protein
MLGEGAGRLPCLLDTRSTPVSTAFLLDFGGGIGLKRRIKRRPTALCISIAASGNINARRSGENIFSWDEERVGNTSGHQGAATPNTFSIDVCVSFIDPSVRERADKAASGTTDHCAGCSAGQCCCQPASRDHRPNTWYGHDAQPCEQSTRATEHGANASTFAGIFGGIATVAIVFVAAVPVVGNDTDVIVINAEGTKLRDSALGVGI